MPSERYVESILIRKNFPDHGVEPLFEDNDCDEVFEFEGIIKLVRIVKSVQNKYHNRYDYIFKIVELNKLEKQDG